MWRGGGGVSEEGGWGLVISVNKCWGCGQVWSDGKCGFERFVRDEGI